MYCMCKETRGCACSDTRAESVSGKRQTGNGTIRSLWGRAVGLGLGGGSLCRLLDWCQVLPFAGVTFSKEVKMLSSTFYKNNTVRWRTIHHCLQTGRPLANLEASPPVRTPSIGDKPSPPHRHAGKHRNACLAPTLRLRGQKFPHQENEEVDLSHPFGLLPSRQISMMFHFKPILCS